jgi:hypothetical protein
VNRTSNIWGKLLFLILMPAAILGLAITGLSQAQTGAKIPNLEGKWGWGRCVNGTGINCMIIEADDPLLTDRARAFQKAMDEIATPKYDCAPMSIPHLYTDPYAYGIQQLPDRVILSYEKDDVVRTVWLEGHGHKRPPLNQFFVHGYSIGHYEGDTLVVTTDRFVFDPHGLNSDFKMPTSTQKRVTERFKMDGTQMLLEVKTEDTFFLREPWVYTVRQPRGTGPLALPWNCDLKAARHSLKLIPTDYPNDPPVIRLTEPAAK